MSKFIEDFGEVVKILPLEQGTTADGRNWRRQTIVVEFDRGGNIIDRVAFEGGNRYIEDIAQLNVGDKVDISYYVTSREWKDRWFTSANIYSIEVRREAAAPKTEPAPAPKCPEPAFEASEGPDLPF